MKRARAYTVAILMLIPTWAEAQPIPLEAFLQDCEKKTIRINVKGEKIGERTSGYCRGVLEGVYAILIRSKAICNSQQNESAEFLLSIVLAYQSTAKPRENDTVGFIDAAYRQALACAN